MRRYYRPAALGMAAVLSVGIFTAEANAQEPLSEPWSQEMPAEADSVGTMTLEEVTVLAQGQETEVLSLDTEAETAEAPAPEQSESAAADRDAATGGELFSDVSQSNWYYGGVSYVMNKGLMTGMGDGTFGPYVNMTRAQFLVVLYRMEGSPKTDLSASVLNIPETLSYAPAVYWADQAGILKKHPQIVNGLEMAISREEMVSLFYEYIQSKGIAVEERADLAAFPDSGSVSAAASEAMSWAVAVGLVSGDGAEKLLLPAKGTSRATCAVMISRLCEKYFLGEFANIPIYAQAGHISFETGNENTGKFAILISEIEASASIKKVEAAVWCSGDRSDLALYTAEKRDGQYVVQGDVTNHRYHFGLYQTQIYVTLTNGLRIPAGTQQANIQGSEAQVRLGRQLDQVYREAGRNLYACYRWVAEHVTYKTLPIPLEPPAGYTADQWYALQAFENREGNCFCYAAAFYQLAKGLGYDAKFVEGKVAMARGGYDPHGWVEITINGATYICDPDMQYEAPSHNFYMQPIHSPVIKYVW
ncbi:GBS Bsp-like repeat-containing protein [Anaerotignum lactatifermentans]|uniref:GBS Bsp-like repeat-containing protein n=1 Tax=Anaerotignum lactatifermentans TaxID=160404 RepID=A0ABS2G6C7_9FIRM|nr:GBS Bsp-like repeat-containing protein [Anaerotignum lactatifermentans]MBM6828821.1 GBS Bsp-like repeat-containing protein [Anaerotignum lactatifermentans]MBM6877006.1 GBS Bsp-like repeat-containing protein [Anaerotignum lactatifermentans]MBM6950564.1 GBS Bsp-like repeat-containing protein [Anaerotignum lactatifermentans]